MEKLVVKTAVKTVLVILVLLIAVFAIFNFVFPQHMATVTEGMGNYTLAVKYASLRYSYTGDCEDLARCFDDSVFLSEQVKYRDEYIIKYGDELIAHKDYNAVCKKKNATYGYGYDYNHRVNSKLTVAYYSTGKKEEAIDLASKDNDGKSFAYGNALMSLASKIRSEKDKEYAAKIFLVMQNIQPEIQQEQIYLQQVMHFMQIMLNEQ